MANVLNPSDFVQNNDMMAYVNYDNLSQERREFLTGAFWDFDFDSNPNAVYWPGNEFLKSRLKSVNPSLPSSLGSMETNIRGFNVFQTTYSGTTAGTFTLEFQDFEDQSITLWLDDYREKFGDREHKWAFRKEDLVFDATLTMMNSSRQPIRKYKLRTCQLTDPGLSGFYSPTFSGDDPSDLGNVSASFHFEHAVPLIKGKDF